MIGVGERIPDAEVWTTPNETAGLLEIAREGPILLLFYLFDWSAT